MKPNEWLPEYTVSNCQDCGGKFIENDLSTIRCPECHKTIRRKQYEEEYHARKRVTSSRDELPIIAKRAMDRLHELPSDLFGLAHALLKDVPATTYCRLTHGMDARQAQYQVERLKKALGFQRVGNFKLKYSVCLPLLERENKIL